MQQQIPPIKITNKAEMYYINKDTNTLSRKQPINKDQESSPIKEHGHWKAWTTRKHCESKKKTATMTNYHIKMNTGK